MKLIFRAFRAIDEPETCEKFLVGHVKVLADYGITNITTNNRQWISDPSIYVVIASKPVSNDIVGGIRVHIADGKTLLPLQAAIGKMDKRIHDIINSYLDTGTGELCGLWNAKEVAGYGLSLLLIRAGISIVTQVSLDSLFTICADYTMPMVKRVGFVVEDTIGKNGDFVYPNENYIARVLRKMNAIKLETADELDRERIFSLREKPEQTFIEAGPKGDLEISYKLKIKTNEIS